AAYVDKFLLGESDTNTNVRVHPFGDFDAARWTAWWGGNNPSLTDWNPGNGKLVQYINRPVDVLAGTMVNAGFAVSQPFAHPVENRFHDATGTGEDNGSGSHTNTVFND